MPKCVLRTGGIRGKEASPCRSTCSLGLTPGQRESKQMRALAPIGDIVWLFGRAVREVLLDSVQEYEHSFWGLLPWDSELWTRLSGGGGGNNTLPRRIWSYVASNGAPLPWAECDRSAECFTFGVCCWAMTCVDSLDGLASLWRLRDFLLVSRSSCALPVMIITSLLERPVAASALLRDAFR